MNNKYRIVRYLFRAMIMGLAIVAILSGFSLGDRAYCQSDSHYQWIKASKVRGAYVGGKLDPARVVPQIRAAGMNTLLVKFGWIQVPIAPATIKGIRDWGKASQAAGMHFFVVIDYRRGNEIIPGTRREVDESGHRWGKTPCPLDAGYWQRWVNGRIEALARLSTEFRFDGVIVDLEMYGADPHHRSYRSYCYCDDCLREFFRARRRNAPEQLPALSDRADWLQGQGLDSAYKDWFVERVRHLAQKVERAAHKTSPVLLLGGLGIDRASPFERGLVAGLGTESSPVLCFTEASYDHGYSPAVATLGLRLKNAQHNLMFIPGLNIASFPAANLAEQCFAAARNSDGYWIWSFGHLLRDFPAFAGYQLRDPKPGYWEALRLANMEIARFVASPGPNVTSLWVRDFSPPLPFLTLPRLDKVRIAAYASPTSGHWDKPRLPRLRGKCPVYLIAKHGVPVEAKITSIDLRPAQPDPRYPDTLHYAVFGADGSMPKEGLIPTGKSGLVRWTPPADGIFAIAVDAKLNAYSVDVLTGQPFGFKASKAAPLMLNLEIGRQYFSVPSGTKRFSLFLKATSGHPTPAKIFVFDPAGNEVNRIKRVPAEWTETPIIVPPGTRPGLWSVKALSISNDLSLYLSDHVSTFLCPNIKQAIKSIR